MKKFLAIMLSLVLLLSLTACSNKHDDMIEKAITELEKTWQTQYSKISDKRPDSVTVNGYFEIKNTKVIKIKNTENEMFKDIDYVIEFVLFTDYYSLAPYYLNIGMYDTVVVYKNGKFETQGFNIIKHAFDYYGFDLSNIIESVTDYGDEYNCKKHLDF